MFTNIQQAISQTLQNASWLTFFIVFWSGALLSLSSCTIVRVPIVIGYIGGMATSKKRAFLLTLVFVSALVLSYTLLGVLFGLISSLMGNMIRWSRYFYYMIGALALLMGGYMTGLIKMQPFNRARIAALSPKGMGMLGAFLFGLVFAIFEAPTCPCCGPVLFIIAGLTFAKGKVLYAVLIFLTYALGQSLPILLIGSFTSIVKYMSPGIERIERAMKIAGGNILLALAAYFFIVG